MLKPFTGSTVKGYKWTILAKKVLMRGFLLYLSMNEEFSVKIKDTPILGDPEADCQGDTKEAKQ